MAPLTLVIGTKRYSSWSLRPWLALKVAGFDFQEIGIALRQPDTKSNALKHSPSGKVPVLKHGAVQVWESLAILEYLAELRPESMLWPADPAARALARSIASEMHGGFVPLRQTMPMDVLLETRLETIAPEVQADIDRICAIWRDCRARHGQGGPFLFGSFGAADAMYAPVVTRFTTYGVELDPVCRAYVDAIWALPAMQAWKRASAS
jgi:glutathione S-transferase